MKKNLILLILFLITLSPVFSANDVLSEEYLKSKNHIALMNPLAEKMVEMAIKKAIKKEAPGKYKVKFEGYTLKSMKAGIFKYLEVTGKNVNVDGIEIPYYNVKTVSDYNWVDYNQNPIKFRSDIEADYTANITENTINEALKTEEYAKILRKINKKAFPMFMLNEVKVKIKNEKLYIIMSYNFPISPREKDRTFMVSSNLKVVSNTVKMCNIAFDNIYGNLPSQKVANLISYIDPLSFTIALLKDKNCDVRIKSIKIDNDTLIVNGKMYIKGDK